MNLLIYPRLGTPSRRAMKKIKGRFGQPYEYRPRFNLVERLSEELGITPAQVLDLIEAEREFLIKSRV